MALLEVSHLGVGFRGADGEKDNTAVDDVSFALEAGEVLGVVGESGIRQVGNGVVNFGAAAVSESVSYAGKFCSVCGQGTYRSTGRGTAPGQRQRNRLCFSGTDVVAESAAYN